MAIQNFDELNIIKRRSMPYKQFFGDMELTPKQKREREDLALILEDYIMLFFDLIQSGANETTVRQEMTYELYKLLDEEGYFETDEQLDKYIAETVKNTYQSTVDNLALYPNDVSEYDIEKDDTTNYWVSDDRAMFIAENESNTLFNSKDYKEAKEKGYTHKIWMAYPDNRVRPTHVDANGLKVPIGSYFEVGEAQMLYPRDVTSEFSTGAEHPEEVINCRCTIKYV